ncbi:MAG: response regulator [Planctomycetaceae bacterium]
MNKKIILVVEENPQTLHVIEDTFSDAGAKYVVSPGHEKAWSVIEANADIKCVLIRMESESIDGCELCRRIRGLRSAESLPILMIVSEDEIELAERAIEAGATDVLIDPFEPRELRMRTNVYPSSRQDRVDQRHSIAVTDSIPAVESVNSLEAATCASHTSVVAPKFDPHLQRFTYGVSEEQLAEWKNDESVTRIALDRILVCPCCNGVPTFRMGCGSCGSAMTEPDVLIHHYACAHIGAEAEFRKGHDLVCPKCRQQNLVSGSDFEIVSGGHRCADCRSRISQPELIGHCLSCQHRFPADDAATMQLTAFHVHRARDIVGREAGHRPIANRAVRASSTT